MENKGVVSFPVQPPLELRYSARRYSLNQSLGTVIDPFLSMNPEVIEEFPGLARDVREAGADAIILCRLQYTTPQQGKAHEKAF